MSGVPCPECGGTMRYIPGQRAYVCTSCGLTLTREEYFLARRKLASLRSTIESDSERLKREYLKWWFSSKKE